MRNLKKVLALVMVMMLSLGIMATADTVSGVEPGDYGYAESQLLASLGVVIGIDDDGDVAGDLTLNRYTAITFIYRIVTGQTSAEIYRRDTKFPDVTADIWAAGYVNWAAGQDPFIIEGYLDGTFGGDDPVLLAEYCAMLCRALGLSNENTIYPDGYITLAQQNGLLKNIDPTKTAYEPLTRMETIVMTYNALFAPYGYDVLVDKDNKLVYQPKTLIVDVFGAWYYNAILVGTSEYNASGAIEKAGQVHLSRERDSIERTQVESGFGTNDDGIYDFPVNVDDLLYMSVEGYIRNHPDTGKRQLLSMQDAGNTVVTAAAGDFAKKDADITNGYKITIDGTTYKDIDYISSSYDLGAINYAEIPTYGTLSASETAELAKWGNAVTTNTDAVITFINWGGSDAAYDAFYVVTPSIEQLSADIGTTQIRTNAGIYNFENSDGLETAVIAEDAELKKGDYVYRFPVKKYYGTVNYFEPAVLLKDVAYTSRNSAGLYTFGGEQYKINEGTTVAVTLGSKYNVLLSWVGDVYKVLNPDTAAQTAPNYMYVTNLENKLVGVSGGGYTLAGATITGLLASSTDNSLSTLTIDVSKDILGASSPLWTAGYSASSGWATRAINSVSAATDPGLKGAVVKYTMTGGFVTALEVVLPNSPVDNSTHGSYTAKDWMYSSASKAVLDGSSIVANITTGENASAMFYVVDGTPKVAIGTNIPTLTLKASTFSYDADGSNMLVGLSTNATVIDGVTTSTVYAYISKITQQGTDSSANVYFDIDMVYGNTTGTNFNGTLSTNTLASSAKVLETVFGSKTYNANNLVNKFAKVDLDKATGKVVGVEPLTTARFELVEKTSTGLKFRSDTYNVFAANFTTGTTVLEVPNPSASGTFASATLSDSSRAEATNGDNYYFAYIAYDATDAELDLVALLPKASLPMDGAPYVNITAVADHTYGDTTDSIAIVASAGTLFDYTITGTPAITPIVGANKTAAELITATKGLNAGSYTIAGIAKNANFTSTLPISETFTVAKADVTLGKTDDVTYASASGGSLADALALAIAANTTGLGSDLDVLEDKLTSVYGGASVDGVWTFYDASTGGNVVTKAGPTAVAGIRVLTAVSTAQPFYAAFVPDDTANFNTPTARVQIDVFLVATP